MEKQYVHDAKLGLLDLEPGSVIVVGKGGRFLLEQSDQGQLTGEITGCFVCSSNYFGELQQQVVDYANEQLNEMGENNA